MVFGLWSLVFYRGILLNQKEYPYRYTAFGLNIGSEIPIPDLYPSENVPQVFVDIGDVPTNLSNPTLKRRTYQLSTNEFILKVANVGDFYVINGNRITINPNKTFNQNDLRVFLLGPAFGALLHQRKALLLHASAVAVNGSAILFMGNSGVGKSTFAHIFNELGYETISDDLSFLVKNSDGKIYIHSGIPRLKLWKDVMTAFDKDIDCHEQVMTNYEKYHVYPQKVMSSNSFPVSKAYLLEKSDQSTSTIIKLEGIDKINSIIHSTYRKHYVEYLGIKKEHFSLCFDLAKQVDVLKISRQCSQFVKEELFAFIRKNFKLD